MSNEVSAISYDLSTAVASRAAAAPLGPSALKFAASSWFVVAMFGQWVFAAYVLVLYGRATLTGNSEGWNAVMKRGYVPGDMLGNLVVALHVAFAFMVMAAGAVQLIPSVRRRWPRFHRWLGRVYLSAVLLMCIGGAVMITTRNAPDQPIMVAAQLLNVLLVVAFAAQALRHAVARHLDVHRHWAMRLYLAASAAWFFRIGLMFWLLVNGGPVGFDPKTFSGPFITFLAFAQYLLPLGLLELYLRAQRAGTLQRWSMAVVLMLSALVTGTGIAGATMALWLPRL